MKKNVVMRNSLKSVNNNGSFTTVFGKLKDMEVAVEGQDQIELGYEHPQFGKFTFKVSSTKRILSSKEGLGELLKTQKELQEQEQELAKDSCRFIAQGYLKAAETIMNKIPEILELKSEVETSEQEKEHQKRMQTLRNFAEERRLAESLGLEITEYGSISVKQNNEFEETH